MRSILGILFALASTTPMFAEGAHYTANHCEIFLDKLEVSNGSHGSSMIMPFVKILPSRLDAPVAEVGFRYTTDSLRYSDHSHVITPWHDEVLTSSSPVRDYWTTPWGYMVTSDFGSATFQGSFYVRTTAGTTYWARNNKGGDFVFDLNAWHILFGYGSTAGSYHYGVRTQRNDLRYYNPNACY